MSDIRKIALKLLMEYEEMGKYVNLQLNSHVADGLSHEERGFLTALLYTAVERKLKYDYIISSVSGRSTSDISKRALAILRLGVCQLLDFRKIPEYAAVCETVELAGSRGERAFVNGVLRRVARERDSLPMPDREKSPLRYLGIVYSVPKSTVRLLASILGLPGAESFLKKINEIPPTDITVNTLRISRDELEGRLRSRGLSVERSDISEGTLRIRSGVDIRTLPEHKEGCFFVQDSASHAASLALAPKPGESVIDVCACPGGKSFAAAIMMKGSGRVTSFDLHESKLSLICSGAERLGIGIIETDMTDAAVGREELFGSYDKVICDVPCSGLGVLAKKPDLRYKEISSIEELTGLQYEILKTSAKYLKAGGYLVYSTCTVDPRENEAIVDRFLSENPDFSAEDFALGTVSSEGGRITLYPHIHNTDGFFIAKLKKH